MFKKKKIEKVINAWKKGTCPYIEKCKKDGKYNKKHEGFILEDCPKRCFEDDYDYLTDIECILF